MPRWLTAPLQHRHLGSPHHAGPPERLACVPSSLLSSRMRIWASQAPVMSSTSATPLLVPPCTPPSVILSFHRAPALALHAPPSSPLSSSLQQFFIVSSSTPHRLHSHRYSRPPLVCALRNLIPYRHHSNTRAVALCTSRPTSVSHFLSPVYTLLAQTLSHSLFPVLRSAAA